MTPGILILAAGQGKRMRSALPKVLHPLGGQPLLFHILDQVRAVSPRASIAIVVGHGREQVEAAVKGAQKFSSLDLSFVLQAEQHGTGHAAQVAMQSEWGAARYKSKDPILVLPGDLPLIPSGLVAQMLEPLARGAAMRLLTCELPDPTGYGRVVRRGKRGSVLRITEERDATVREKQIREVGASIYTFQPAFLNASLQRLSNRNAQKEYYLTDLVSFAARAGKKIDVLAWASHEDLRGINDRWELAQAAKIFNMRCIKKWALQGVRFVDPDRTQVECDVEIAEDATIHPDVLLAGQTRVGRGAQIGQGSVLTSARIGADANIKVGTVIEDSEVGEGASIGPYAHLRPESFVGPKAKIGNFVELKKSRIGEKTSVAHLSYLGDAEVGKNVNIGCGFVTCNFDGRVINGQRKHKTLIEDDVFMGSDCQTIAPVRIGRGSYVASGSTITEDVEADSLAIARSRQVNKVGYAKKLREK